MKKSSFDTLMRTTALLSMIAIAAPAYAQDAPQPTEAPTETVDLLDLSDEASDEVVVTGSRIRRNEFTAATPVQVITTERSKLSGLLSASEILQGSSVAAGSGQINDTFTGFVVNGGAGVNTLSLRGLGAQRTLVLLNGRRVGPSGVSGTVSAVDLNIIPNSVVNRFEILKDGASSIYGSDAVAGVANIITSIDEGFNFGATANVSEDGGGESSALWGSWGKTTDLLAFSISGEYQRREELNIGDRPNLACPEDRYFALDDQGNPTNERTDAIDPRTGEFKCYNSLEGYLQTFFPASAAFGVGGSFFGSRTYDPAGTSPVEGFRFIPFQERSFDDPRQLETDAISPTETFTIFSELSHSPTQFENLEVYAEVLFNRRESRQENYRQLFPFISAESPVNPLNNTVFGGPFDYGPLFGLAPGQFIADLQGLDVRPIVLIPFNSRQEVNYLRGVGGIRGTFADGGFMGGWGYDLNLAHSTSSGTYYQDVVPQDRLEAGIGTRQNGIEFIGVCGPTAPAGCIPFNLAAPGQLQDGAFTAAEQDYFFQEDKGETSFNQTIIEGVVTGDLFDVPYGTVGIALGASARFDKIDDIPGATSRAANSFQLASANRTKGDDSVYEIFGEVEVPLLAKKPLVEELTLNASGRISDYKSVGTAETYKLGLNWAVNNTIRFRGTHGTSFRAPALYELFLAEQTAFLQQTSIDPCIRYGVAGEDGQINTPQTVQDNCAADGLAPDFAGAGSSARLTRSGGLGNLRPETSEANSVGVILTPEGTGLSLSVDYFEIEVDDQITSTAAGVIGQCYRDPEFRSGSGFCDLFTRVLDPNAQNFGSITDVNADYRNIVSQKTKGLDFTGRYEKEFTFGDFAIDAQWTYTDSDRLELFADDVDQLTGLAGEPDWVGTTQARFTKGDWTGALTMNYVSGTDNFGFDGEDGRIDTFYSGPSATFSDVDEFVTFDASIRKEWDTMTLIVGSQNIFNEEPSLISDADDLGSPSRFGNYPFSSQYINGYIGRQFFVRLDKEF
ncbi:TonB-dependent receptor plug domain-containing protein [Litorimonas sp. RW-G-Af-16]|uniref:TonB-dependent receptor plug domain-containing protein n=1 Tax=Litorimonas sp. RW-G-Af-16 TaxID=3241168 RepID=UPI00390C746B